MLLLIDDRMPPDPFPEPRRRRLPDVNRRALAWLVAAVASMIAGVVVSGLAGVLLVMFSLIAACSAATSAIPYSGGLSEHRQ
jgi:hypothetical protein